MLTEKKDEEEIISTLHKRLRAMDKTNNITLVNIIPFLEYID